MKKRILVLSLMACLLTPVRANAEPGELKVFSDWIVGCSNTLACEAISLGSDSSDNNQAALTITRKGDANAEPEMLTFLIRGTLDGAKGKTVTAAVDGNPLDFKPEEHQDGFRIDKRAIDVLRNGREFSLIDEQGNVVSRASLTGMSAALLRMDEQQNRIGTVTALIRKGGASMASIPKPPATPVIVMPPLSSKAPVVMSAAHLEHEQRAFNCRRIEEIMQRRPVRYQRLDDQSTLALVPGPCGTGAYNEHVHAVIVAEDGTTKPANLEFPQDLEARNEVVNSWWDKKEHRLASHAKGRGLGDCGTGQRWAWDGRGFRLTRQFEMSECRGPVGFITTWQAETKPQ